MPGSMRVTEGDRYEQWAVGRAMQATYYISWGAHFVSSKSRICWSSVALCSFSFQLFRSRYSLWGKLGSETVLFLYSKIVNNPLEVAVVKHVQCGCFVFFTGIQIAIYSMGLLMRWCLLIDACVKISRWLLLVHTFSPRSCFFFFCCFFVLGNWLWISCWKSQVINLLVEPACHWSFWLSCVTVAVFVMFHGKPSRHNLFHSGWRFTWKKTSLPWNKAGLR